MSEFVFRPGLSRPDAGDYKETSWKELGRSLTSDAERNYYNYTCLKLQDDRNMLEMMLGLLYRTSHERASRYWKEFFLDEGLADEHTKEENLEMWNRMMIIDQSYKMSLARFCIHHFFRHMDRFVVQTGMDKKPLEGMKWGMVDYVESLARGKYE